MTHKIFDKILRNRTGCFGTFWTDRFLVFWYAWDFLPSDKTVKPNESSAKTNRIHLIAFLCRHRSLKPNYRKLNLYAISPFSSLKEFLKLICASWWRGKKERTTRIRRSALVFVDVTWLSKRTFCLFASYRDRELENSVECFFNGLIHVKCHCWRMLSCNLVNWLN